VRDGTDGLLRINWGVGEVEKEEDDAEGKPEEEGTREKEGKGREEDVERGPVEESKEGARGPAPLYMLPASIQPFSAQHFLHMGVEDFLS
jgi:hypothetical protein